MEKKQNQDEIVVYQTTPEQLIAQGIEKGISVDALERLLAMRKELKAEQAREAFHKAMAGFQGECPVIEKTKKVLNKGGQSVRYKYAPLDVIVAQVKDYLKKYGFSHASETVIEEMWVTVICTVTHEQGYFETSQFKVPIDPDAFMNQPQRFASAVTFAKRYAFCNALGILTGDEDDDSQGTEPEPQALPSKPKVKQDPPISKPPDENKPIDIMTTKYGGTGKWKDRIYIDVPSGYLKAMLDEKFLSQFSPTKKDAIYRTLAYLEDKKIKEQPKDEIKQSAPPELGSDFKFDNKGNVIGEPLNPAPDNKDEVVGGLINKGAEDLIYNGVCNIELPKKDPKIKSDTPCPEAIEMTESIMKHTALFSDEEKARILEGTRKLEYNLSIAQAEFLISSYKQRYEIKYGRPEPT